MSGLDDLLAQIPTSDIASKIGVDEGEVNKAVQLLVPVLVGGLHENAQDPDHASKIESAADSHAGLLDGGVNVDQVDQQEGQQAIARIFGGNDAAPGPDATAVDFADRQVEVRALLPGVHDYRGTRLQDASGETEVLARRRSLGPPIQPPISPIPIDDL